jgi:hypothetical protein
MLRVGAAGQHPASPRAWPKPCRGRADAWRDSPVRVHFVSLLMKMMSDGGQNPGGRLSKSSALAPRP